MTGAAVRDGESGFTLVELVIGLTILGMIMGAIVAAFVVGVNTTGAASTRLSQSDDRHLVEVWLPRDLASAQTAATNHVAGCAAAGGATAVLVLTGSGITVTPAANGQPNVANDAYEADYVLTNSGTGQRLTRYFCDTGQGVASTLVVSYGLASGSSAVSVTLPGSTPGVVTMKLTDKSGNTFVVSGLERS